MSYSVVYMFPGAQSTVLFPATVERVWAVVRAKVSGQLNVTVGWDDRIASYGKMESFEVEFITESMGQPKKSSIFQARCCIPNNALKSV